MSAYFNRLAQRTGLVSAGHAKATSSVRAADFEIDLYREIQPQTSRQTVNANPAKTVDETGANPAASLGKTLPVKAAKMETGSRLLDGESRAETGTGSDGIQAAPTMLRQLRGPTESVKPVSTNPGGLNLTSDDQPSMVRHKTKRVIASTSTEVQAFNLLPGQGRAVMADDGEQRHPPIHPKKRDPFQTLETGERRLIENPVPEPKPDLRVRATGQVYSPTGKPQLKAINTQATHNRLNQPLQGMSESRARPTVHIGSVHLELHQPPPRPDVIPTAAPQPQPVPPEPRPISLRRLYLRGW
ncbi:MAG: hypothetical protein ABW170_10130 [Candidatus Thiodiazotropha sp. L084R]